MKNMLLFILLYVVNGVFGESVSVTEGDSVTLHNSLPEIQGDDVLEWRFGAEGALIAQINRAANKSFTYDVPDGRFRGRLKLNNQSGDLTIRNIRTEHSGPYEVTSNKHTQIFNVSGVPVSEVKCVSVLEEDPVTLNTGVTEILRYDEIRWRFEHQNSPIAEINRKARKVSKDDGPDGRFRDRLQLDYWTGSLTIRNTGRNHSGLYEVDISNSSSKHTIHKSFSVTVSGEKRTVSVTKGQPVTLDTDLTEIHTDDFILWMFGDTVLAEIYKNQSSLVQHVDERFRDTLQLNNQTGSLTITQCKSANSGLYELKINRHAVHKRFTVTVSVPGLSSGEIAGIIVGVLFAAVVAGAVAVIYCCDRHKISKQKHAETPISLLEGDDISLTTDGELQRDDQILWTFGDGNTPIAEINGRTTENSTSDVLDWRFRDRVMLDDQTGSLTITNAKTTDSGRYVQKISRSGKNSFKRFSVSVFESRPVTEGESVTLNTDAKLQTDDVILWMYGDKETVIAETKEGTRKTTTDHGPDQQFRDRLKLDHQTGSLTITNITVKQTGRYKLQIISSGKPLVKFFNVSLSCPTPLEITEEEMHLLRPEHSLRQRTISNEIHSQN